ncbi:MAG TPA: metalloregulator ArsR/SmtB family transcription factor [Gemmatimonadota bacterium]|nr:metalloregulator ArsR/SmtB family transcription factor [Gemmatimonadota bacterium]
MTVDAPADPARAAALFQALSDEKRLRILTLLSGGELCVCELTDALDVGQSLLSFHLKTLRDAGLVTDRREGRWAFYALATDALAEAGAMLAELAATDPKPRERAPRCAT